MMDINWAFGISFQYVIMYEAASHEEQAVEDRKDAPEVWHGKLKNKVGNWKVISLGETAIFSYFLMPCHISQV